MLACIECESSEHLLFVLFLFIEEHVVYILNLHVETLKNTIEWPKFIYKLLTFRAPEKSFTIILGDHPPCFFVKKYSASFYILYFSLCITLLC